VAARPTALGQLAGGLGLDQHFAEPALGIELQLPPPALDDASDSVVHSARLVSAD
jgi:hypothetical protein